MGFSEIFDSVRHSVVALGSRWKSTPVGEKPHFPTILGTGYVVDSRGIIATNRHVVQELLALPKGPEGESSAISILFTEIDKTDDESFLGLCFAEMKLAVCLSEFKDVGNRTFFGEEIPDIGFVQIAACELPSLSFETRPGLLRVGLPVASIGFPAGDAALAVFNKLNQLTPFLNQGVVSSLMPFPCPRPHGFSVDIMIQGGASGSPIFSADTQTVVGMIHSHVPGTNMTFATPSHILQSALDAFLKSTELDMSGVSPLSEILPNVQEGNINKLDFLTFGSLPDK